MSRFLTRLSMVLATLFIMGGLSFGVTEAFGSNVATACNEFGQLGTCPGDYADDDDCNAACIEEFGSPGLCFFGCCNCTT